MIKSLKEMHERRDALLMDATSIITGLSYIAEFIQEDEEISERCRNAFIWMMRPCLLAAQNNMNEGADLMWKIDNEIEMAASPSLKSKLKGGNDATANSTPR